MNYGSCLKQYVLNRIFDLMQELANINISELDRKIKEAQLNELKEVRKLCEERGRY